jgi:IS605 OrfB family transposase
MNDKEWQLVPAETFKTLRLKVKANSYGWLNAAAMEVNTVWNWANETASKAARPYAGRPKFLTGYDLGKLAAGSTTHFEYIGAETIERICAEYATKRRKAKKPLRWRRSLGSDRSLGWIPFKAVSIKRKGAGMRFCGKNFRVFERELLNGAQWAGGCFAEDACGDWWLCLPVSVEVQPGQQFGEVGIDIGLKDIAVTSDGQRLEAAQFYRGIEPQIAQAQRRGHKRQAKLLHRTAAHRRKDALHKFTTSITQRYSGITVGDVSSLKLAKTSMAKSTLDAGWGMLREQLRYKCQQAGLRFEVVNESNTTRACSECGCLSGPQGLRGLVVREWRCEECGALHDRDVNSAINIRHLGGRHAPPLAGTLCQTGALS